MSAENNPARIHDVHILSEAAGVRRMPGRRYTSAMTNPEVKVLLQDFVKRAKEVADAIHQPRPSNAVPWPPGQKNYDRKLSEIEQQLRSVAVAIERYTSASI
jgi:hypothetical protein